MYPQAGLEHICLSLWGAGITDVHPYLLLSSFFFLICVGILPKYMCVPGVGDDQKRVSDPLQLEFQMVLSCHVSMAINLGSSAKYSLSSQPL